MKKAEQLLKTQTLPQYLMEDKEFVKEAKNIFNEKGVELSNENLKRFLEKIQGNLIGKNRIDDEELKEVFGGLNNAAADKTVEVLIRTSTTIIGTCVGLGLGALLGGSYKHTTITNANGEVTGKMTSQKYSGASTLGLGALGGFIGEKLGELIVKKIS